MKSSKARLPRIELPKFTGDIKDWQAFHTAFASLVDTDESLTNADKLSYLLTCVKGEARSLISHLRQTDDAYPAARDILSRRYENPRMLADTLINRIMQLPQMQTRTAGLRARFLDPLLESYKGLKGLEFPVVAWSYLLLHIALAKISGELRETYETKYGSGAELPTFDNLIAFLEGQCRVIVPNEDTHSCIGATEKGRSTRTVVAAVTTRKPVCHCAHCNKTGHVVTDCHGFRRLGGHERQYVVRRRGLCYRCLGHHRVQDCAIKTVCDRCRFNGHHTLLHLTDREWKRHAQPPQTRHRNFGRNSPAARPQERTYGWRKPPVTPWNSAHTSPRRVTPAASLPTSPVRGVQPGLSFQRRNSTGMIRGNSRYGRSLGLYKFRRKFTTKILRCIRQCIIFLPKYLTCN